MELILAIVVVTAVIFFGALISMGNERQRKAIDGLREQVVLWAVQDLKIKREHLIQSVQVHDPLEWLNKTASKACGYDLNLQVLEVFEKPETLICASGAGNIKVIFSPFSPVDIRRIKGDMKNRLSQFAVDNPLLHLPKGVNIYELSVLNSGHLFDLEVALAWKSLTNQSIKNAEQIWMYSF